MVLLLVLLFIGQGASGADSLYWYNNGARIWAPVDTTVVLVKWSPYQGDFVNTGYLSSYSNFARDSIQYNKLNGFHLHPLTGVYSYNDVINMLAADPNVVKISPVMRSPGGRPIFVGDQVVCMLNDITDRPIVDSVCGVYGLRVVEESQYRPGLLLLEVGKACQLPTIDAANLLWELPETKWCEPNFASDIELLGYRVEDEYFWSDQWNVKSAIGYKSTSNYGVWEITRGNPVVTIAVLDQGMEWQEDFDTSLWDDGNDFVGNDRDPAPQTPEDPIHPEAHGMHVLGLIAAMHNNPVEEEEPGQSAGSCFSTSAGIAPGCYIEPLRILDGIGTQIDDWKVSSAFYLSANVGSQVINCSWGYLNDYYYPDVVREAVAYVVTAARGGKGCIVVAATGNGGADAKYPSKQDSVITVGAINSSNRRYAWSNFGESLDLLSAAGPIPKFPCPEADSNRIFSVDRMGLDGDNPKVCGECDPNQDLDYACSFGGTSSAAPSSRV